MGYLGSNPVTYIIGDECVIGAVTFPSHRAECAIARSGQRDGKYRPKYPRDGLADYHTVNGSSNR